MYERCVKRLLDVTLSSCALLALSWLFADIALAIKLDDPGPVFFTQRRIGTNKTRFNLHNIVTTEASLIKQGQGAELRHVCNETAAYSPKIKDLSLLKSFLQR